MAKRFHLLMPLFALPLQPTHSGSRSSHGPTSPMATSMSMSVRVPPQCRHILQSTWCARPVCMQQPYDMHAGLASLTIWPDPLSCAYICRFCFIYCGLRFYAQSHSDDGHVLALYPGSLGMRLGHVHATAPCSAHVLAQASPTMSYIPLVY